MLKRENKMVKYFEVHLQKGDKQLATKLFPCTFNFILTQIETTLYLFNSTYLNVLDQNTNNKQTESVLYLEHKHTRKLLERHQRILINLTLLI